MNLDPLHLRAFTALMNEGSVSRASLELRTSPSNVRRIWQSLEEQLGDRLFISNETGETRPTSAAKLLDREMTSLLAEMRRFEASVDKIHRKGRTLRLGADRNVFNTRHFGRLFNSLRHDNRFRISFLEVSGDDGRGALESGACDMVFALDGTPGRRFESRDLPPMRFDVACARQREGEPALDPSALADLNWSLADFSTRPLALDRLKKIEACGGGSGSLCSQTQFMRWAEERPEGDTEAIVCVQPASFSRSPQVSFLPFESVAGFPLCVTYLRQHPYEFLPVITDQMERALKLPADGSRPSLS